MSLFRDQLQNQRLHLRSRQFLYRDRKSPLTSLFRNQSQNRLLHLHSRQFLFRDVLRDQQPKMYRYNNSLRIQHQFSINTKVNVASKERRHKLKFSKKILALAASGSLVIIGAMSYKTRQLRYEYINDLPLAKDIFTEKEQQQGIENREYADNNDNIISNVLAMNARRSGLMGTSIPGAKSVKDELDLIRDWHVARNYKGGLVLRELTQPLFGIEGLDEEIIDPLHLHQRECYYLYYEIKPDGQIKQQIFCRGTTLLSDIVTCLQAWLVWDDELGCMLHKGFKDHADRLINDVQPLLVSPTTGRTKRSSGSSDGGGGGGGVGYSTAITDNTNISRHMTLYRRSTIELCGHSLGGAVAYIVAMKLHNRGYNVVQVTSIGSPRFTTKKYVEELKSKYLSFNSNMKQNLIYCLRIEDDYDPIPYLPPFGFTHIGNKLWFVNNTMSSTITTRYVNFEQRGDKDDQIVDANSTTSKSKSWSSSPLWWVDSIFMNVRLFEILFNMDKRHRIPNYVSKLDELTKEIVELKKERKTDEKSASHGSTSQSTTK